MRRIKGQRSVLICPHHQGGKITEEIICRVQASSCSGPDIGNVPIMKPLAVIESNRLEFAVPGDSAALENEKPLARAAEPGHNDWFISRCTLQVPHPQRQMLATCAIYLDA